MEFLNRFMSGMVGREKRWTKKVSNSRFAKCAMKAHTAQLQERAVRSRATAVLRCAATHLTWGPMALPASP